MNHRALVNKGLLIELSELFQLLADTLREKYNVEDYYERTGRVESARYQQLNELLLKKGIELSYEESGRGMMSLNNVTITFTRTGTKLIYSVKE